VVHISHDGVLANSNSVSVSAKGGEFVDQMCNISLTLNLPTTTIVAQPFLMFC
jgi:hypothetical protein